VLDPRYGVEDWAGLRRLERVKQSGIFVGFVLFGVVCCIWSWW